ncbi:MAG: hypothetical protein ACLP9L_28290 [Thermoguttaceae bacterium]
MTSKQWAEFSLGLAIALAGLIPGGTNLARGANLARYLSSDFCAAVVIHPDRISKSTLAVGLKSSLPKEMLSDGSNLAAITPMMNQKNLPRGMDLAKLAELLKGKTIVRIVVLIDPILTADVPAAPGIIVQFGDDIDGDAILSAVCSEWQPAETNGVKYKTLKNPQPGKPSIAALAPDARTLIAGLDGTVVKMLAKDQGSQPLLKQLRHTNFDNDIILEFSAEPLLAQAAKRGEPVEKAIAAMDDLLNSARSVKSFSVKVNFSGESLLHAEIVTDTPVRAAMCAAAARSQIADIRPQFEAMKKQPPPLVPPPALPVLSKLGDEVFDSLTVKNEGPHLTVDLPMPASLPEALRLAGQIAAAQLASQMQPPATPPR